MTLTTLRASAAVGVCPGSSLPLPTDAAIRASAGYGMAPARDGPPSGHRGQLPGDNSSLGHELARTVTVIMSALDPPGVDGRTPRPNQPARSGRLVDRSDRANTTQRSSAAVRLLGATLSGIAHRHHPSTTWAIVGF